MMRRVKMTSILLMAVLMLVLSSAGCNFDRFKQNDSYVKSVKELVDDTVNATRSVRQLDKSFNSQDSDKNREYLKVCDDLIGTLEKIQKLQATDEFDDMDRQLKEAAKDQLNTVMQLHTLIQHAGQTGDDSIYQREKDAYLEKFEENYENMRSLSSEIQTYWRNA